MTRWIFKLVFLIALVPIGAISQDNSFSLAVHPSLQDSGLMKFIVPRYSLKTGVFIDLHLLSDDPAISTDTDVVVTVDGRNSSGDGLPVIRGYGLTYVAIATAASGAETGRAQTSQRFINWLASEVGKRTIEQFRLDGEQVFTAPFEIASVAEVAILDGDQVSGERLAYKVCGRCHVIGEINRMKGLESTPSFALLRSFDDWRRRFETFYVLNPHPSFTQVASITEPFNPALPPPISPIELTATQLEDIVAYVSMIEPANLGAPLVHQ